MSGSCIIPLKDAWLKQPLGCRDSRGVQIASLFLKTAISQRNFNGMLSDLVMTKQHLSSSVDCFGLC